VGRTVTTGHASAVPPSTWRLSLQELAERAGARVERVERLVELGILAPAPSGEPFRSGDIHRVRAVAALEDSGVQPQQIAAAMEAGEFSFGYLDYVLQPAAGHRSRVLGDRRPFGHPVRCR
jgi:hypothetical protein